MSEIDIAQRLEKLERDNRRLKGFAFLVLLLATALATIYATQPVPDKITAHEVDVVDRSGKVRVQVDAQDWSGVHVFDAQGHARAGIAANTVGGLAEVWVASNEGKVDISAEPAMPPQILLQSSWMYQERAASIRLHVEPFGGRPTIDLSDSHGFQMALGSTGTGSPATGATQETSAASIVMFGNDKEHHVIWRAP